ncbi:hypothetical protein AMTRI_Chr02g216380 [Amborella trichopoda]
MGNGTYYDVLGVGTFKLCLPGGTNLLLTNTFYAPNTRRNLISVPRLDDKGYEIRFRSGRVTIGKHSRALVYGTKVDNLYQLNIDASSSFFGYINASFDSFMCMDHPYLWHLRL